MDYQHWKDMTFPNVRAYNMLAVEMTEDLVTQLAKSGGRIHKSIPVNYVFGAIATSADGSKFLKITTEDLRNDPDWFDKVSIQELNYDRTPANDTPHICSWDKIGEEASKYLA